MPRFLPLLLALALGAQPVGEAFFYLWYFFDNPSFENTFCENLDKPELECHGNCQLMKMADVPEAPEPGAVPEPIRLESCLPPLCRVELQTACLTTNDNAWPYQPLHGSDWISHLLKPPAC
ncbi:MAG: hypothetical protein WA004_00665 [Saprospiraceae bacterium]